MAVGDFLIVFREGKVNFGLQRYERQITSGIQEYVRERLR